MVIMASEGEEDDSDAMMVGAESVTQSDCKNNSEL